jgi:hypothetical protein
VAGYEESHFRETIDNDKDAGITIRERKLLDEIHGNGVPRTLRNWELSEESVRSVVSVFAAFAKNASSYITFDEGSEARPYVLLSD